MADAIVPPKPLGLIGRLKALVGMGPWSGHPGPYAGGPAGVNKSATIDTGSITGNTGIIGVNQEAGNFGNQANIVSFAAVTPF